MPRVAIAVMTGMVRGGHMQTRHMQTHGRMAHGMALVIDLGILQRHGGRRATSATMRRSGGMTKLKAGSKISVGRTMLTAGGSAKSRPGMLSWVTPSHGPGRWRGP